MPQRTSADVTVQDVRHWLKTHSYYVGCTVNNTPMLSARRNTLTGKRVKPADRPHTAAEMDWRYPDVETLMLTLCQSLGIEPTPPVRLRLTAPRPLQEVIRQAIREAAALRPAALRLIYPAYKMVPVEVPGGSTALMLAPK